VNLVTDYLLFILRLVSFLFISGQSLTQCSVQADIAWRSWRATLPPIGDFANL